MNFNSKIEHLVSLGNELQKDSEERKYAIAKSGFENSFFIPEFIEDSMLSIIGHYLNEQKLISFCDNYTFKDKSSKSLGIITAGNIPLVGIHDLICGYLFNATIKIKTSTKDEALMKFVVETLIKLDPSSKSSLTLVPRLSGIDAVIATGSTNTNRYFEYYFKHMPNLLRGSKNGVAVLNKDITDDELLLLMDDICLYFGLGCRSVSHLFIEKGFSLDRLQPFESKYKMFMNHVKYMNNYDYNKAVYLVNMVPFYDTGYLMFKEDHAIASPMSVVNYSLYENKEQCNSMLEENKEIIQCVVGKDQDVPFGSSQFPSLDQFADDKDSMAFLASL